MRELYQWTSNRCHPHTDRELATLNRWSGSDTFDGSKMMRLDMPGLFSKGLLREGVPGIVSIPGLVPWLILVLISGCEPSYSLLRLIFHLRIESICQN